jgi:hypothetical protein
MSNQRALKVYEGGIAGWRNKSRPRIDEVEVKRWRKRALDRRVGCCCEGSQGENFKRRRATGRRYGVEVRLALLGLSAVQIIVN